VALSRSRTVAAIAVGITVALGFGSGAVIAPDANALGSTTTLTVVEGRVLVRHSHAEFAVARAGDVVAVGDTVQIGNGASAEITYFDGSSVRLESEMETVVDHLGAGPDQGAVTLTMRALGRTWHVVTTLIAGGSRYDVRTSSTASVRG